MGTGGENFCLRWSEFQSSWVEAGLATARAQPTFSDVTLASEDGEQLFPAHRLVLACTSPVLARILQCGPGPGPPLLWLRGVAGVELGRVLDYVYTGEASVPEDRMEEFLRVARDLQLQGLADNVDSLQEPGAKEQSGVESADKYQKDSIAQNATIVKDNNVSDEILPNNRGEDVNMKDISDSGININDSFKVISVMKPEDLKETINSMMERGDKDWICKACGNKFDAKNKSSLMRHIEHTHLPHVKVKCEFCGKLLSSRKNKEDHVRGIHRREDSMHGVVVVAQSNTDIESSKKEAETDIQTEEKPTGVSEMSELEMKAAVKSLMERVDKEWHCRACGFKYSEKHKTRLPGHIRRHHMKEVWDYKIEMSDKLKENLKEEGAKSNQENDTEIHEAVPSENLSLHTEEETDDESSMTIEDFEEAINSMMKKVDKQWLCGFCGNKYESKNKSHLSNHIEHTHMRDVKIKCDFCSKLLSSRRIKEEHVRDNHAEEKQTKKTNLVSKNTSSEIVEFSPLSVIKPKRDGSENSPVWQFLFFKGAAGSGPVLDKVYCRLCTKVFKRKDFRNCTSNYISHVASHHPEEWEKANPEELGELQSKDGMETGHTEHFTDRDQISDSEDLEKSSKKETSEESEEKFFELSNKQEEFLTTIMEKTFTGLGRLNYTCKICKRNFFSFKTRLRQHILGSHLELVRQQDSREESQYASDQVPMEKIEIEESSAVDTKVDQSNGQITKTESSSELSKKQEEFKQENMEKVNIEGKTYSHWICKVCQKNFFGNKTKLSEHILVSHLNCEFCTATFSCAREQEEHTRAEHPWESMAATHLRQAVAQYNPAAVRGKPKPDRGLVPKQQMENILSMWNTKN